MVLHKYLIEDISRFPQNEEGIGKATIDFACAGDTRETNYSLISDDNYNLLYMQRQPNILLDTDITLYSQETEVLLLRLSKYAPKSIDDFSYAIATIQAGNKYTFDCNTQGFANHGKVVKSIFPDLSEVVGLRNATINLSLSTFPIEKEITNIEHRYYPYQTPALGNVFRASTKLRLLGFTESRTLWYPLEWVENKREHMEVVIEVQDNTYEGIDFKPTNYWQKHEGTYPPPIDIHFSAPSHGLEIEENDSVYTAVPLGEAYMVEVEYDNVIGSYSDREQYKWVVSFSADKSASSWKLPSFSDKIENHLEIQYRTYDGIEMQPSFHRFQMKEGATYQEYIKDRFALPSPTVYKNMGSWTTTTYIRKKI